jgi:hypothetical protein
VLRIRGARGELGGQTLRVVGIVFDAALFAPVVWAGPQNATARALLADWKEQDPGMTTVAEVKASAFASG